jgi:16S rRNA (guanine527-N7)-methyltransferase
MQKILEENITKLGLNINKLLFNNLLMFWNYLLKENEKINLISRSNDEETRFISHIIDSLTGLCFNWPDNNCYLDLGSGGGFPALPLKICNPDWSVTLVESTTKKASFLYSAAKFLQLDSVIIQNSFLEPKSLWLEPVYDLVTSRGFSSLKKSFPLAALALKKGGLYLAYKGPKATSELSEAANVMTKYNFKLVEVKSLILPYLNIPRFLYLFAKE